MAVINPTVTDVSRAQDESCYLVVWTPVTQADTCQAVSFPQYPDRSIQVFGTFGGTSVSVQGANTLPINIASATFVPLFDPSSTIIAITAATVMKAVLENAVLIRPFLTGGAATSITISMLFRMGNPLRT